MLPVSGLSAARRRFLDLAPIVALLLATGAWPAPAAAAGQSACVHRPAFGGHASMLLVRAEPLRLHCGREPSGTLGYRLEAAPRPAGNTAALIQGSMQSADSTDSVSAALTTTPDPSSTDAAPAAVSDAPQPPLTGASSTDAASAGAAVGTQAATDGGSTDGTSAGAIAAVGVATAPWVRSMVCPVLYAHEVPSQAGLRAILLALVGAGYQPTTLHNVDLIMSGTAPPLPGCLVLTFDDALYTQYLNAIPVLLGLQIPAVFFVMPAFADGVHRYMAAAQIAAIAQAGFEVEAHTCNHPSLPTLARRNYGAFLAEIVDCRRMIENITGVPVPFLAYPDGSYDARVLAAVADAGYRGAFTTRPSAVLNASSPYTLPRIEYNPSEAPDKVIARLHAAGA